MIELVEHMMDCLHFAEGCRKYYIGPGLYTLVSIYPSALANGFGADINELWCAYRCIQGTLLYLNHIFLNIDFH